MKELTPGYKLWLTVEPAVVAVPKTATSPGVIGKPETKRFEIHNGYAQPLTRWWYSQGREDIINTVIDDTNYIVSNYSKLSDKGRTMLSQNIHDAVSGIQNMKQTYSANVEHKDKLDMVIKTLTDYAIMPNAFVQ